MSLCGIPYFYSGEFEDLYFSMIDFLYVDKEIKPDYVRFQDNKIYIRSAYTKLTEENELVDSILTIVLDYGESRIERDTLGYKVDIDFFFQINGEVKTNEMYKRRFKNLDNVEDYNKWVDLTYHITPWLIKFKKYEESEEDYK